MGLYQNTAVINITKLGKQVCQEVYQMSESSHYPLDIIVKISHSATSNNNSSIFKVLKIPR